LKVADEDVDDFDDDALLRFAADVRVDRVCARGAWILLTTLDVAL